MARYHHLVALGSSFAAGPGIDPIIDSGAGRSGRNYAHRLAERLGAQLTDLTVSGATTATILDHPQRTGLRTRFAAQIEGVPADADLITITAGGNDLGYAGGMLRSALAGWLRSRAVTRPLGKLLGHNAVPTPGDSELALATAGLVRVVETARARAPQARVVLVDYLTVVGDATSTTPSSPLTPSEIEAYASIGRRLNQAFAAAAAQTGADLVVSSALSADHALGSSKPWVTGFTPTMKPMPFHPTATGMQVVADAIYDQVTT